MKVRFTKHKGSRIDSSGFNSIICLDRITKEQLQYCGELDNWFIAYDPDLNNGDIDCFFGTHCNSYGSLKSALRKIRRWNKPFRIYEILHKYENYHVTVTT